MAVALAPFPVYRAANNNGNPLAGGFVDTFAAGTFTPLATFSDSAGVTPNSNPVVLDASGRANIYFTIGVAYKIRQRDSTGVTLWTVDNFLVSPQGDPTLINDYSSTVAQSEETLDPGEVGTEVLAQSMTDELKELRFVVKEMKGTASWRTSNATRHVPVFALDSNTINAMWIDGSTTQLVFYALIPDGWQAGSLLTLFLLRRSTVTAGTSSMSWTYLRHRDGTAQVLSGSAAIDFTPGDTNDHLVALTINPNNAPTLQVGDFVSITVSRTGGADSSTGNVVLSGAWLEFTGIASR